MSLIIEMIDQYRQETDLRKRLSLADNIYWYCADFVQLFIYSRARPSDAADIWQETSKTIVEKLTTFKGRTEQTFRSWCYQIATHKIGDAYRGNRLDPFPEDELNDLIETSTISRPFSPGDEVDLKDALNLLEKSHPECRTLLWNYFVIGLDYDEIAEELKLQYDAVRMRIKRCLDAAGGFLTD
jgi:RNA polymerase sigma factor (sigma-70 family)